MRQSYFLSILTTFLLLCTTSLAWPWPPNFGELIRRQDNGEGDRPAASRTRASASESGTITAKPDASASETGDSRASDTAEGTGEATATATGTGKNDDEDSKATGTEDASASESAAMTTFDERLPAGGIQLITPAPISGSQYYKIGDDITFKWNYTSVSKTPSKIDVLVSCSKNQATYTIAANQSVEETGSVLFDSKKFATGTAPLFE
ncbi:MAG: hypothetical protein M1825_000798 [Sarcosagium campestre]|nr:MAG: hypothetical protein M1825_000798 [Sarcosagium campestre]